MSELSPNPVLFQDGVEAGDVIQGALGGILCLFVFIKCMIVVSKWLQFIYFLKKKNKTKDCWFLGALSVVAERDKLFYALFNSEEISPCGYLLKNKKKNVFTQNQSILKSFFKKKVFILVRSIIMVIGKMFWSMITFQLHMEIDHWMLVVHHWMKFGNFFS